MATTEDGIWTPDQIDDYNLVADLATMSSTVQDALERRANAYRGTSTQRNNFTSSAPEGSIWVDTNGDKEVWVKQGNAWVSILGRSRITEENLNASRGYIRFADGRQEAWVKQTGTAGGTLWTNGIYYSDVTMGNWAAPFSRVDSVFSSVGKTMSRQYWTGISDYSNTSAGIVRAYRPTSTARDLDFMIRGWGLWD